MNFRFWTLGFGRWPLDFGLFTLDSGLWFLDFSSRFSQKPKVLGLWALEFVFWSWDFEFWGLDSGLLIFPFCALAFSLWYSGLWTLCIGRRTLDLGLGAFWIFHSGTLALGVLDF